MTLATIIDAPKSHMEKVIETVALLNALMGLFDDKGSLIAEVAPDKSGSYTVTLNVETAK